MSDLELRSVELRADAETGTVEGIAVPWNTPTNIGGKFTEQFERGSIDPTDKPLLFWNHSEPIGRVIESEDRDEGHWIRASISDTSAGRDARTLMRDGVIDKFSVGFVPVEHREDDHGVITRTSVHLREVSAVPFPAYRDATISHARAEVTEVREDHSEKEIEMAETAITSADLDEVRETVENLDRRFSTLSVVTPEPVVDTRSAGEILKALAAHDESAERAYTGGTTADLGSTLKPTWAGDLTRLIDEASPIRSLFATGTLPAEGNFIEYGVLDTDSSAAGRQVNEGDVLTYGKVTVTSKTAPVLTYGGYSTLSFQEIQRSSVNILNTTLNGQAIALGKVLNTAFRTTYLGAATASITASNMVDIPAAWNTATYDDYLEGIVDAAGIFQDNGLSLDALIVSKAQFKNLVSLKDDAGRPMFLITGAGTNNVGAVSVTGLSGDIAGLTVVLDPKLSNTDPAVFVNRNSIREYKSPVVRLQDSNILNLTQDFSLYTYSALAVEIPAGIVPVITD